MSREPVIVRGVMCAGCSAHPAYLQRSWPEQVMLKCDLPCTPVSSFLVSGSPEWTVWRSARLEPVWAVQKRCGMSGAVESTREATTIDNGRHSLNQRVGVPTHQCSLWLASKRREWHSKLRLEQDSEHVQGCQLVKCVWGPGAMLTTLSQTCQGSPPKPYTHPPWRPGGRVKSQAPESEATSERVLWPMALKDFSVPAHTC